jgi:CubicO group peptidase (beta-lactamase class C family)
MKSKKYISLFYAFILLFSTETAFTQTYKKFEREEELSEFVKNQMQVDQIPGLSLGFVKNEIFWANGYGYIDLENKVPADKFSTYRLASNTKSMTAAAVLKLYEDNKLQLDDPVNKYVPYFPNKKWPVTIRQLLGHIGGISHYKNYEKEGQIKENKHTKEAIEIFDEFELVSRPGTKFNYSSYGYNLLGAVIEEASDMPYEKYLDKYIWEPLKMDHIFLDEPQQIIENRAEGYKLVFGKLQNSEFVNITSRFASGGICASVTDLLKYGSGLNSNKILSENTIQMMESSMALENGVYTDYGMGWRVHPVNGHHMIYHTGGQPETRTMLVRLPEENLTIAVAYNLEGGHLRDFPKRLFQLIMNENWNIKPYADNEYDRVLFDGLWDIYNYGIASYMRKGELKKENIDLSGVFEYLNKTLHPDSLSENFEKVRKKINLGRHPRAEKAYIHAGRYMASQIVKHLGKEKLEQYHKQGAIPFFVDYMNLTQSEQTIPHKINEVLKTKLLSVSEDWNKTWNEYTQNLWLASYTDLDAQVKKLEKLFSGKDIYPDFAEQIGNAIREKALKGDHEEALKLAKEFTALYPESAIPQIVLNQIYVINRNQEKAEKALDLALNAQVDRSVANPESIVHYAKLLFKSDYLDEALLMIHVAEEFYPENALLHKTKGDIYLEKSRRQFQKALQIDPTIHETRDKLDKIE